MNKFTRDKRNPIQLIDSFWPDADISHITFDPNMKSGDREYWRAESTGGDGTLSFTIDMLRKLLFPLVVKSTYCKNTCPEDGFKDIKYTIGYINHAVVFGLVELKCSGKYQGQIERARIPVRCSYIKCTR